MWSLVNISLLLSGVFFVWASVQGVVWLIKPYLARREAKFSGFRSSDRKLILFALLILLSVWALRFAVGLYRFRNPDLFDGDGYIDNVEPWNQIINSLLHAFMSFSMDEDFTAYMLTGQVMIGKLCPETSCLSWFFSVYSALLNFLAPVAGGAIILDILTEISPRFRYFILKKCFWREMYFFPSLNNQSLALAKSIVTSKHYYHSIIVFTDAYSDDEDEASSERLLYAKSMGAICLKDDLMHISVNRWIKWKTTRIFLADRDENNNLEDLSEILSIEKRRLFRKLEIYVLSSDHFKSTLSVSKTDIPQINSRLSFLEDEVVFLNNRMLAEWREKDEHKRKKLDKEQEKREKRIQKRLPTELKIKQWFKKTEPDKEQKAYETKDIEDEAKKRAENWAKKKANRIIPLPRVTPVNSVRNMAQNLFEEYPLFECCRRGENDTPIRLTIFGSGVIGTEILLNAYWMGQILHHMLQVTVVSQESEQSFKNKIDYLNPEILRTVSFNAEPADTEILRYNRKDGVNAPYMTVRYIQENVLSSEFIARMRDSQYSDPNDIIHTDYFVVALGSDEDNFTVADKIRQYVGYSHLNCESDPGNTIIAYVVYNLELCNALNKMCRHKYVDCIDGRKFDVYMHAFGSMDEVYSIRNVLFENIKADAEIIGEKYRIAAEKMDSGDSIESIRKWDKTSSNYYNRRADLARRLHLDYKAFSAGKLTPSLFYTNSEEEYRKNLLRGEEEYRKYIQKKRMVTLHFGISLPGWRNAGGTPLCVCADSRDRRILKTTRNLKAIFA